MKRSKKTPAPKTTKAALKKGATSTDAATKDVAKSKKAPRPPRERDPRLPAPGATIDRQYKGKEYRLKFLDEGGVEVDGKVFGSLSAAARDITGAASINGFLWAGLIAREVKPPKTPKAATPKTDGHANDLGTPAGQRAAIAASGIAKRGRPISKSRSASTPKSTKGE